MTSKDRTNQEKNRHISFREAFFRGFTELVVICLAILFFFLIYKFDKLYAGVRKIATILMPIIVGFAVAYLLNPVVKYFEEMIMESYRKQQERSREERALSAEENASGEAREKKAPIDKLTDLIKKAIFGSGKKEKNFRGTARLFSVIITFAITLLAIYVLGWLVVPAIYENVAKVVADLPGEAAALQEWINTQTEANAQFNLYYNRAIQEATNYLTNWVKNDMFGQITTLISGVVGVASALLNILVGLIVAVYVLMSKETFKRQGKKIIYALADDSAAEAFIGFLKDADGIFGGFISGKIIDSAIIGVLCLVGALILNFPYPVLVAVIVGVTNVIPFFGPYIGAVPCAILIFLVSPSKGLIFIIFILILQQVDGNIIGPRILGESTGLSPFWVVFSILLGGGLFGVVGMLIGVPVFGVIYHLASLCIEYTLEKKGKKEMFDS